MAVPAPLSRPDRSQFPSPEHPAADELERVREPPECGKEDSGSFALLPPDPCVYVFQGLPSWAKEEASWHPPLLLRVY